MSEHQEEILPLQKTKNFTPWTELLKMPKDRANQLKKMYREGLKSDASTV